MVMRNAGAHARRAIVLGCLLSALAGCGRVPVTENGEPVAESPPPAREGVATVTLNWTPPDEYADGSHLHDLAGYRIYSGQSEEELEPRETLNNPGLSSHVVELEEHELYLAMTSVNSEGVESALSEVVPATPDG